MITSGIPMCLPMMVRAQWMAIATGSWSIANSMQACAHDRSPSVVPSNHSHKRNLWRIYVSFSIFICEWIKPVSLFPLAMGTAFIMNHSNVGQPPQPQHVTVRPIQQKAQYVVRPNDPPHSMGSGRFFGVRLRFTRCIHLGPSSPDYQHSPSNSHCSSNHNPPSIQSNPVSGAALYDKVSTSTLNYGDNGNNPRALLLSSKPNLRSFTVPAAPPIIPPPTMTNKQQAAPVPSNSQCMSFDLDS